MMFKDWNIEAITGYKPKTTFYMDFSIADKFGADAIKDTYNRAFNEWKNDYEYLTELVMVLNWKAWEHSENNVKYTILYNELWEEADNYALKNLKDEKLDYFCKTTD